jgi:hypothetical protein
MQDSDSATGLRVSIGVKKRALRAGLSAEWSRACDGVVQDFVYSAVDCASKRPSLTFLASHAPPPPIVINIFLLFRRPEAEADMRMFESEQAPPVWICDGAIRWIGARRQPLAM